MLGRMIQQSKQDNFLEDLRELPRGMGLPEAPETLQRHHAASTGAFHGAQRSSSRSELFPLLVGVITTSI